jgi:hypothetical protein
MLDIVEAEISRVVYFRPKTDSGSLLANDEEWTITQEIAKAGSVQLDRFFGNLNWMRDRIKCMEELGAFEEDGEWLCCCGSKLDGSHDHNTCGPPIPPGR